MLVIFKLRATSTRLVLIGWQLPQKRKRPEPKPSWGPKSSKKQAGANKSAKKALAGFSKKKEDDEDESPATPARDEDESSATPARDVKKEAAAVMSPQVSTATKSKLAAFTANESVSHVLIIVITLYVVLVGNYVLKILALMLFVVS